MVENIAIIGLDREQSYETAKILAEQMEMQFLDTIELFEFDNIPRTFSDMIKEYGLLYFRKKEKGTLKYAAGFSQTVINCESGMAMRKLNFERLSKNCLIIYLHQSVSVINKKLNAKKYQTPELKKFYNVGIEKLNHRIKNLKKYSNIQINAKGKSSLKLCSEIIRNIKEYYNVV